MKNQIKIWLIIVFLLYVVPWFKIVYFQWDDIELLMQFRSANILSFFTPHSYQFVPIFLFLYWLEIQLFGITPSLFFLVSVFLHLCNIFLTYNLINRLTKRETLALIAAIMVSFNKSFYPIIFWPTMQTQLLLTTLTLIALILFHKSQNRKPFPSAYFLFLFVFLASITHSFGIPTGAGIAFAILLFWPKYNHRIRFSVLAMATSIMAGLCILVFSSSQLLHNNIAQQLFSPHRLFNIIYFSAVGPTQSIISRFFLPGFTPNVYNIYNILIMIAIPATTALFVFASIRKIVKNAKRRWKKLITLFVFGWVMAEGYFMASLVRSGPGAHKALTERYSYFPLFGFALFLVYSFSFFKKSIFKFHPFAKVLVIGSFIIIMIGHFIGMQFFTYHFFTSLR